MKLPAGSASLEEELTPTTVGEWRLVEDTPSFRRYELDTGEAVIRRTEYKQTQAMLRVAAAHRSVNAGKPWGDGAIIGSVPTNLRYSAGLAEANRQGDKAFIRKWWNDPDHALFRWRDGKL